MKFHQSGMVLAATSLCAFVFACFTGCAVRLTDNEGDSPSALGAGTAGAGAPLAPGVSPETSEECGTGTPKAGYPGSSKVIESATDCFWGEENKEIPAAAIEQIVEIVDDVEWIHIRLTLDPRFVDNSYGANAIGWGDDDAEASEPDDKKKKKTGHTFDKLVGSDHAEMILKDKAGSVVLHFKLDYISENSDFPSGYGTNGVSDKDGGMIEGDEKWILGASTSLHRNFNGCGLDEYTVDSPATDESYTPNPDAPEWDFRVVYEVWVDATPFAPSGFGDAIIEYVHASPSKIDNNTIEVTKGECPESDEPDVNYWGDDDTGDDDTGDDDCGSDCTYVDTDLEDTPV